MPPQYDSGYHYTDRLQLTGDISSVECWRSMEGPTVGDLEQFFEHFEVGDYRLDKLTAAYRALKG
ncbi:unnamed protein product [marine sediment metagenome]|uniref:Uncharacterized protein n=1 Tax=marine sediment metagenome TaxID=412755 RepID=X0ZCU9_9ZZZZ